MPTLLRRMPEAVRELRCAWPSVVSRVRNLTDELEKDFRFGQRISKTDRGFFLGGTIKGGSSSMWYPASERDYDAYLAWRAIDGIAERDDPKAYERLRSMLDGYGVTLRNGRAGPSSNGYDARFGTLYAEMEEILRTLPEEHLDRETLLGIQLGGWGPDCAKASAYQDGHVLMYDFAVRGAKRTFLGLFLHELGHAHEHDLSDEDQRYLFERYKRIVEADALVGIEFLLDAQTRRLYQRFVFNEFLAECYLLYAACGRGLLDRAEEMKEPGRSAWREVYDLFRKTFHGVEYE